MAFLFRAMKTGIVFSDQFNPYLNLAVEQRLMEMENRQECVLFLWRNERTVVIGRNQNPWTECAVETLLRDDGFLVRRRSGGGAVYHDLGNLNFSFVVRDDLYDVTRQLCVIAHALQVFGLDALVSGRNDLMIGDRKFSGNAFLHSHGVGLHHGTILLRTDSERMRKYLTPPREKLAKRGAVSVRSRVVNLTELKPDLTVEALTASLRDAFAKEYGEPMPLSFSDLVAVSETEKLCARYMSQEWIYGDWMNVRNAPIQRHAVFPWGICDLAAETDAKGRITKLALATDALDTDSIEQLETALIGWCSYSPLPNLPFAEDIVELLGG